MNIECFLQHKYCNIVDRKFNVIFIKPYYWVIHNVVLYVLNTLYMLIGLAEETTG